VYREATKARFRAGDHIFVGKRQRRGTRVARSHLSVSIWCLCMYRSLYRQVTDWLSSRLAESSSWLHKCWCGLSKNPRPAGISAGGIALVAGLYALGVGQISHANRTVLSNVDCLIEPSMVVELGAAVPGQLSEVVFDRSDYVSAGAVMAKLESSVEETVVQISEQVANASVGVQLRQLSAAFGYRTEQRNHQLLASNSISEQSMDQVSTETKIAQLQLLQEKESLALAKLEVARAKATLNRRNIISPISGSVTRRYKNPGEFVDSDPVFQIVQLNPLHVEVLLPVSELGTVSVGSQANIKLDVAGFDNKTFDGKVRRIDTVADAASGTYGIRVELENPELKIPSGVRCQADFLGS